MKSRFVRGPEERWISPEGRAWRGVPPQRVPLQGTPVGMIPSRYLRETVDARAVGATPWLEVRSLHDGTTLAFRLEWPQSSPHRSSADPDAFPDAAGVLLPATAQDTPIVTMGSPDRPVEAWYWRGDRPQAWNVFSHGVGSAVRRETPLVRCASAWGASRWAVVVARKMEVAEEPAVQLKPGLAWKVGFAAWDGGHRERGGLKAFSVGWQDLWIEGIG